MAITRPASGDDPLAWVQAQDLAGARRLRNRVLESIRRPDEVAQLAHGRQIDELLADCKIRGRLAGFLRDQRYRLLSDALALIAANVWRGTHFNLNATLVAKSYFAEQLDALVDGTKRLTLARESLRRGVEENFQQLASSPNFATYLVLSAVAAADPPEIDTSAVRHGLAAADAALAQVRSEAYLVAMRLLGLRLRTPAMSVEDFTLVLSATLWGMAHRALLAPTRVDRWVERGTAAAPDSWHLVSLASVGHIDEWFDLDPEYDPVAALQTYLNEAIATDRPVSEIVQIPGPDS